MLKYGYQLENYDWSMNAMYIEDEIGKMKLSKIWYIPNVEYMERCNSQNVIINPIDKLNEMENEIKRIKETGKHVGVILTYFNGKGKYTLKSKTYNNYKSFMRNAK